MVLGYPDQALKRSNEAIVLAKRLRDLSSQARAELFFVVLRQRRREAHAVQQIVEAVIALCAEHQFTEPLSLAKTLRGWAMAEQGHHERGIAQIQEGLAALNANRLEAFRPYLLCLLAEVCGKVGRLDEGLCAVSEALTVGDERENRKYEAEAYRLKGELLLQQGDCNSTEAQKYLQRAIRIAQKQRAKSLELRATMSLARLLAKQGLQDQAHGMLAKVYGWFGEGFDTPDLKDVKALLDDLADEC
ncbi:MAG: hypothetical protein JO071_12640 [Deltaproteobacteria bacterium]|nr:hypothetical protein [Deltaproteobacteria bacterium]